MKILKYCWTILVLAGVLLSSFAFAIDRDGGKDNERTLRKPLVLSAINFDGNRIDNDMENNGMFVSYNISGRSGLSWPAGNGTQTIFASGIWFGGKVDNQVRISAGEFSGEYVGGPWGSDNTAAEHKFYKVNKSDLEDPLANDDFQNWPARYGAPFVDNNDNGTYEPLPNGTDMPQFIGDQVVWAVMNDGDPTAHAALFGSAPLGLEYQMTVFGFDRPDAFGDMMFIKALFINKGGNTIDDAIIGLWSDPDLGDASDDFVGCDTTLGMGIVYNNGGDANFAGYHAGTPAAGYDFFQGPMVPSVGDTAFMFGRKIPNMRNLKMTSFSKYTNPDPIFRDPENAIEAYNYMIGLMPDGTEFPAAATGGTKFMHPGDPRLDTGPDDTEYVDEDLHPADDRRFLMNAGPFTMAPGDSQEVVFAIFHAAAGDALNSYGVLKIVDTQAQFAYDNNFILPSAPDKPEVAETVYLDEIVLKWGSDSEIYSVPGPDSPTGEETTFEFEGYNVYQYETANGDNPVRIATYDVINDVTLIKDTEFVTELGELVEHTVQYGSDSGLKRSISITQDYTRQNSALIPYRAYYFGVTAYSYNEWGSPKVLETTPVIITVRPQSPDWEATDGTGVYGDVITAEHTAGVSDGVGSVVVVDPKALTGADYEMFFQDETYYRDVDGLWKNKNSGGKEALQKILDCSGSMITVAALASATVGTYDLTFNFEMDCGSNLVDGIMLDFADDVVINSWDQVGDCSNGADAGQNCVNMEGTLDAATNSITWGNDARSGFGMIEHGQIWVVNIQPATFPINVDYAVYDDVYDGTQVDAVGTATASELGYDEVTIEGWYARNLDTGEIVTPHTTIQSGYAAQNVVDGILIPAHQAGPDAGPIAEGLQFRVDGPELGFKRVYETNAAESEILDDRVGLYPSASLGTTGYILSHRDHADLGAGRTHDRFGFWVMDDLIIDFSETSVAWDYINETVNGTIPYSVYRIKFPSNERVRLFAGYWDYDEDLEWSITDPWSDFGAPSYEPIYAWQGYDADGVEINYDPANDAQYEADNSLSTSANTTWGGGTGEFHYPFLTASLMVMYRDDATPPFGNKIWITTFKANTGADKFLLSTAALVGKTLDYDPGGIGAWPNPYFAFNPEERTPIDQQVHFTGLPSSGKCTIRIFDLAGVPVRVMEHEEGSTLEVWNLKNDSNIPVASGMYIAVVETDQGQKVLKLAVVQPEQRLDLY